MPLSSHEEAILAEISRQVAAEDPGLVAALTWGDPVRRLWRTTVLGAVLAVAGLAAVIVGAEQAPAALTGTAALTVGLMIIGRTVRRLLVYRQPPPFGRSRV